MAEIQVYTTSYCPYCSRAKELLKRKGASYEEINLDGRDDDRKALEQRTGMRTVPQIFIGGQLIGGFTDLAALDSKGELDPLLK